MDDVQKKVRGLDELEKRVAKLEKQLAELQKPKAKPKTTRTCSASSPARKSTPSRRLASGHSEPNRGGLISKDGAVPGCSPSSCTGNGSGVSTSTTRPRSTSARGSHVPL